MTRLWPYRPFAPVQAPMSMHEMSARLAVLHGVELSDIRGPSRALGVSRARQAVMAALIDARRWSSGQIGQYLGGREHSTVLSGAKAHRARVG